MTTSPVLNAGIIVATLLLIGGLICSVWAVVEHVITWRQRAGRAKAKPTAPSKEDTDPDVAFWAIAEDMPDLVPDFLLALVGIDTEEEPSP